MGGARTRRSARWTGGTGGRRASHPSTRPPNSPPATHLRVMRNGGWERTRDACRRAVRKGRRAMGLVPSRGGEKELAAGQQHLVYGPSRPPQCEMRRAREGTGRATHPLRMKTVGAIRTVGDRREGRAATAARTAPPHTIPLSEQHRLVPPCLAGSLSLSVWERGRSRGGGAAMA